MFVHQKKASQNPSHKSSNEMEPYYMVIKSEINTIELFYSIATKTVSLHN